MLHFSPLATIPNQNKLTGTNYVDWKRNLDILLNAKGYKYVITTPCPPPPGPDSHSSVEDHYTRWQKADEMARCYILASMINVLQHQQQSMTTASEMILNLKEMFGEQGRHARLNAMQLLVNTKMSEGTPVREHV